LIEAFDILNGKPNNILTSNIKNISIAQDVSCDSDLISRLIQSPQKPNLIKQINSQSNLNSTSQNIDNRNLTQCNSIKVNSPNTSKSKDFQNKIEVVQSPATNLN